eukprot:COSAG06_NODE_33251_length_493_cov_0.525381_2_plen_43_part_01
MCVPRHDACALSLAYSGLLCYGADTLQRRPYVISDKEESIVEV